ncbi:SixA phosphatase family protein [Flavobacteriaceae bacterium M23B6Z8]
MKKILLLFAAIISFHTGFSQEDQNNEVTTYYLIRHAEKDRSDSSNKNPNLTQEGMARALNWAEVFDSITLDEIYSTNYSRTKQTAEPTAFKQKKRITYYDPSELDFKNFIEQTKGKKVLVVGHSNTTPWFTNQLLGEETYEAMDDSDNGGLYIVTIVNGNATSTRLTIN